MPSSIFVPASCSGSALLLLAGLVLVTPAAAGGVDPFATDAQTPAAPAASNGQPCTEAGESEALTLPQVVDLALCHNPQTREAWANARWRAAQLGVAESAWLPTLAASLSTTRVRPDTKTYPGDYNQKKGALTLSWLLFDFGARAASIESSRQLLVAAGETQNSTVQAVFLAAIQAFYQVQANDAALLASQESERAAGEALRAADARYRVGSGTPADRLQAQTAYSQATLQRISAQGNVHIARGTLANTIGRDAQKSPPLVPASDPPADARFADDVGTLIDEARRRRPDLRASEAQLRSAEADRDAARAAGWPSVTLAATANNTDTGIASASRDGSLGVRLDIPLFTGFATHYRVRSAEAQREVKEAQREKLRLQVALDVWNAYQNLITATQSVKSAADLLDSAEQSARVALGRYQAGVGIILDLLNAQSALASARLQEVQAKYNWRTARATLAQAIGTLDAGLLQPSPGSAPASAEFNAAEFNAAKAKARP